MPFPYNDNSQPLSVQGILAGVAGVSAGQGAIRVSSIDAVEVAMDGDATNNRVSALQAAANNLRVSAFSGDGGTNRVSAIQGDAGNLMVSTKSGDAGLLRMSAIGGTAGDRTIVDGSDQTISARIKQISAVLSASDNAFIVHAVSEGAGRMQVSAKSDSAALLRTSAFQGDGASLRVSAIQEGAGALMVSAKSNDAALLRMSAIGGTAGDRTIVDGSDQTVSARIKQISAVLSASDNAFIVHAVSEGAGRMQVSAKSDSAALLRTSAFQGDGASLRVSAIQDGAAALNVSAKSDSANLFRVSAIVDNGSISAKSSDAGTLLVSAKQGDAALHRVSAIQDGAAALNVSAKSNDGALLRTSAVQDGAAALNVSAKSDSGNLFRTSAILTPNTNTSTGVLTKSLTVRQLGTATTIKSSGGVLYGWYLKNDADGPAFLQFFNVTGSPTVGTDTPAHSLGMPALAAANLMSPHGIPFATGIVIAATTTPSGSTAPASGMIVNLWYI